MYRCVKCKKLLDIKKEDPIRCPFCGYKILFRERPKIVKRVRAE